MAPLQVDEEFIKKLTASADFVQEQVNVLKPLQQPPRPWMEDKLMRFLTQLKAQQPKP